MPCCTEVRRSALPLATEKNLRYTATLVPSGALRSKYRGMSKMSINIRVGLLSLMAVTALVGCGKKEAAPPAADTGAAPAAAAPVSTEEKVVNDAAHRPASL